MLACPTSAAASPSPTSSTKLLSPEQVSSHIIRHLVQQARVLLGDDPALSLHEAVITVPAYFNTAQRRATIEAARLAGIKATLLQGREGGGRTPQEALLLKQHAEAYFHCVHKILAHTLPFVTKLPFVMLPVSSVCRMLPLHLKYSPPFTFSFPRARCRSPGIWFWQTDGLGHSACV